MHGAAPLLMLLQRPVGLCSNPLKSVWYQQHKNQEHQQQFTRICWQWQYMYGCSQGMQSMARFGLGLQADPRLAWGQFGMQHRMVMFNMQRCEMCCALAGVTATSHLASLLPACRSCSSVQVKQQWGVRVGWEGTECLILQLYVLRGGGRLGSDPVSC